MPRVPEELLAARDKWTFVGSARPAWAEVPSPSQRSVWDFPRPPRIEPDPRFVRISLAGRVVAETERSQRVLETASPPTFYVPVADVRAELLEASGNASVCEWKGRAQHFSVRVDDVVAIDAAWTYPDPFPEFARLASAIAFHPGRVDCTLDGVVVLPQAGGYYGGWITPDLAGPFKGPPGTEGW